MHIATDCATPERIRLRAALRRRSPTEAGRTTTSTGQLPGKAPRSRFPTVVLINIRLS